MVYNLALLLQTVKVFCICGKRKSFGTLHQKPTVFLCETDTEKKKFALLQFLREDFVQLRQLQLI